MQNQNQPPAAPQSGPAQAVFNRILDYIRAFEQQLDGNQEIAMLFAASEGGAVRIEGLGFSDPDLITFYGRDESGLKTQLIQHIGQVSVMLRAVPKAAPDDTPARRIGFLLHSGWLGGESGDGSV